MEWHVKRGISAGHLRGVDANYRGSVAVEDVRTEPVSVRQSRWCTWLCNPSCPLTDLAQQDPEQWWHLHFGAGPWYPGVQPHYSMGFLYGQECVEISTAVQWHDFTKYLSFFLLLSIKAWTWLSCLVLDSLLQYLLLGVELLIHPLNYSLEDAIANAAVLTVVKGGLSKPHRKDKIERSLFWVTRPLVCIQAMIRAELLKTWAQGVVLTLALAPIPFIKCLLFLLYLV